MRSTAAMGMFAGGDDAAVGTVGAVGTQGRFSAEQQDEWLWGWDETAGIVSVWASREGRAAVWRREPGTLRLVYEERRFRPWVLLATLDDLAHLGARLVCEPEGAGDGGDAGQEGGGWQAGVVTYRELHGPGRLRYRVSAQDGRALEQAILRGASQRLGERVTRLAELGEDETLALPPEEQYLVATGRTYFRGLAFDDAHRLQFDLETTGLDASRDRIFLIAVRDNRGYEQALSVAPRACDAHGPHPNAEAELIRRLVEVIAERDPDVIENHNAHGFDLPFLVERAQRLRTPLTLGRAVSGGAATEPRRRPAARAYGHWRAGDAGDAGANTEGDPDEPRGRFTLVGRELIDTLDAVRRYDFAARDLPGHGLKALARHFGIAGPEREYVPGAQTYTTWLRDPERVRRYALDDVREADGLAQLLGGAAFALARMAPRRYERLADAGPATGVLDPLLTRAYLRAGEALPARTGGGGAQHTGAALYLFAAGVARRVVKADVSSLYPSLMRQYRISPQGDHLGALLALVDRLVVERLAAKARARAAVVGSRERHTDEALSAAMKILVNSAYGYLGAAQLTRLADVDAANEVTRRGREVLGLMCRELARRGVTLLEADTDGVYFAAPEGWSEADERRVVAEVAALLPALVRLEFEGRYAAMLSHEPKNYALLPYDGPLILRGVAFHSSRGEPFGEAFLRRAIERLLNADVVGARAAFVETVEALRRRALPTEAVAVRARLTKLPQQYLLARRQRREAAYEALLASGRDQWKRGERIRFYRATGNRPMLLAETLETEQRAEEAPRDYDVEYYVRLLRETYAARLARAFTPDDFEAMIADPERPALFLPTLDTIRPTLTTVMEAPTE